MESISLILFKNYEKYFMLITYLHFYAIYGKIFVKLIIKVMQVVEMQQKLEKTLGSHRFLEGRNNDKL